MLELLVVDDNMYFSKTLINNVVQNNPNLRLCMIATDGQEALDIISKRKLDIILLDLKLPVCSGLEVLDILEKNNKEIYNNSIIVISGETDMISEVVNNPLVYDYLIKGIGMEKVVETINNLCKEKEMEILTLNKKRKTAMLIKKQIYQELSKIGYNVHYNGTKYLMETIYYLYCKKSHGTYKLEKEVYPIIAKKYSRNINTIKSDIIKATKKINYDNRENELKKYFSYFLDNKIKPKLVINTVLNKIAHKK